MEQKCIMLSSQYFSFTSEFWDELSAQKPVHPNEWGRDIDDYYYDGKLFRSDPNVHQVIKKMLADGKPVTHNPTVFKFLTFPAVLAPYISIGYHDVNIRYRIERVEKVDLDIGCAYGRLLNKLRKSGDNVAAIKDKYNELSRAHEIFEDTSGVICEGYPTAWVIIQSPGYEKESVDSDDSDL
jgi:2-polyprenyl-3-methyl-5-hydroxy-6-metoxy-1,4-benzoquinol methylase